jgi:hypothetical protein
MGTEFLSELRMFASELYAIRVAPNDRHRARLGGLTDFASLCQQGKNR